MAAPTEFRAVWPNFPVAFRVREFRTLAALQRYVASVLECATRNQARIVVRWVSPTECRLGKPAQFEGMEQR